MNKPTLVLDVESAGLHGVGFAVGAVVVAPDGQELASFYAGTSFFDVPCSDRDREWLQKNCLPTLPPPTHHNVRAVHDAFWTFWLRWRSLGATMWADCGWPVEARFLAACVDDDRGDRAWDGPYPLHEIAQIVGIDTHPRLPNELPVHNPLNDARQSARLLVEALRKRTVG